MLPLTRTSLPALILACAAAVTVSQADVDVIPFEQVRSGMKGTGRTVFSGTEISEFQVEILGTLPNIAPDQNLILARLSGGPLADTGVLAGMSGSPVFIDGKLVGAVAYSWGFSRDTIAGITPIREMLSISRLEDGPGSSPRSAGTPGESDLQRLRSPAALSDFFTASSEALAPRGGGASPLAIPLSVTGIGQAGLASISPDLRRSGFLPVQGAASGGGSAEGAGLEPGSAVAVKLVRGDLEMAASGTVTWVDGDRVLAFGHPLMGLGEVDLPMTAAHVEAILPSLRQSSRLARPTAEVGALRQDRVSGILGRLGASAGMIPVRVRYFDDLGIESQYSFEVTEDPLLAPILVYISLNGILASRDRAFGSASLRIREGSGIRLGSGDTIDLDNLFSGTTALFYATGTTAYILHLLMNNDWSPPGIAGINLMLEFESTPRTARIRRVTLDRYRARPGDTIRAQVLLNPYRGQDVALEAEIPIPAETPPGLLTLHIGGALSVSRAGTDREPLLPVDLEQFVWLINHLRRNDRVYIVASTEDDGALLGGVRLPNLPPSAARILVRPQSKGNFTVVPQRTILETSVLSEYSVHGMVRVQVRVEDD